MRKLFLILLLTIVFTLTACLGRTPDQSVKIQPTKTKQSPTLIPEVTQTKQSPTLIPEVTQTIQPTIVSPEPDVFSPEFNGLLTFYSNRDGNPEIYIQNGVNKEITRLTYDPSVDDSPALSPDGNQVVFLSARNDPNPHFPNLKYEIYLINSDGSNLRRLTYTEETEDHPAWSPDGEWIVFDADYDNDSFFEIYKIRSDGSSLIRLTTNQANDQFADWSPDGEKIAFASDRNGGWDLFVMNTDGSDQQSITSETTWELFPAWSPDGNQISFTGLIPNSRNTDVFLIDSNGENLRQLTNYSGFDENPAWTPDGTQITFQTTRNLNFSLYTMNLDGSDQTTLLEGNADFLWPSWGPVPPLISFIVSGQELGIRETFQTALGDLDGDGDLDAVFANPMQNYSQVWFNDGSGTFINSGQQLTQFGHGVGLADFDQDGDLDIMISCHQGILPSKIYFNDGTGQFIESDQELETTRYSGVDVNLIDLNDDGHIDAHIVYYSRSGVPDKIYYGDGTGYFEDSGLSLDEDFLVWGDIDGDKDIDAIGKIWGQGLVVLINQGKGNLQSKLIIENSQTTIGDIALADFDKDDDLDAFVCNGFRDTGSYPCQLFWNDGNGNFSDSGLILPSTMGAYIAVGDLDLDGDLDVVITNMDQLNQIWLYENNQFVDSGLCLGAEAEMSGRPTLGDIDGDGDLDLIIGRFRGGAQIWFNMTNVQ